MTHYELTQLATRQCEHGKYVCCTCPRKQPSAAVQKYLDQAKRRYPKSIAYNPEWKPEGRKDERYRWVEHPGGSRYQPGLRFIGKVQDIRTNGEGNLPYIDRPLIDHNGWYTDPWNETYKDGSGLCWGVVYQLPTRRRKGKFILGKKFQPEDEPGWMYVPGYVNGGDCCNDGVVLDFHSITSDLKDAIRWADSMAEHAAEEEKEYQTKSAAEDRVNDHKAEIEKEYQDFRKVCRELRANRETVKTLPEVQKLIRSEYRRVRSRVRKLRAEIRKIESDPYSITY